MAIKRIVANIATEDPEATAAFYSELFGLHEVMNHGWILTLAAHESCVTQLGLASEGGSSTDVPELSVEVDDLDATLARAKAMELAIEYGPVSEPWGVRRFYVRDPVGTLLNVLVHE